MGSALHLCPLRQLHAKNVCLIISTIFFQVSDTSISSDTSDFTSHFVQEVRTRTTCNIVKFSYLMAFCISFSWGARLCS
jgi:hypothetical protein